MANERILVVEDEPVVAELIVRYLKQSGYQVAACVATGEEALTEAGRTGADLALMDIGLRGDLDGVQTAGQLRARFDLPVVFLTGLADDETIKRSQEAQAFGYLIKPFRQEELKAGIDLALSKHPVERRLRRIEGWFTATIKSIGEAVITADEQGRVTFLNPAAETLTGWRLAESVGSPLVDIFQLVPGPEPVKGGLASAPGGEPVPGSAPSHSTLRARHGTVIPVEWNAAPIRDEQGAVIGRVLIARDITERLRAESELTLSREQLRSLAAHLQDVREEERTRIAREVHDELGQMVTGLRMDLAWLEKRLPSAADHPAGGLLAAKTKGMAELLDRMVKTVRQIAADLRPGMLDDLGLAAALEWQARDWQARTGIECHVSAGLGRMTVPPERGTALFRIFQEALTNVARHAHATQVEVRLRVEAGWLLLEIQDNGRGITEAERQRAKSLGLLGMKERATLLGGEFGISGEPGRGTTVRVRIPANPSPPRCSTPSTIPPATAP
jgi:two-component system sensor histidine kinase UhpB